MTNLDKFIKLYQDDIVDSCLGTGLFPSVCLTQMILEGGGNTVKLGEFGLSTLAYKYNNYGGIKAWAGYTGKTVKMPTKEVINGKTITVTATFCHFESVKDFVKWRTIFLKRNSRYKKYGVFSAETPIKQFQALKAAGYATDPNYVASLTRIYNQYNLRKLDELLKKKV